MNFEMQASGQGSRDTSLSALRYKGEETCFSKANAQAVKTAGNRAREEKLCLEQGYHLDKKNRPFSDCETHSATGIEWYKHDSILPSP